MPEITEIYIRIPVADKQENDQIRTVTISQKEGIKALYAFNRKKILTYLFARSFGWTLDKAKEWTNTHAKSLRKNIKGGRVVKQYGEDLDFVIEPLDDLENLLKQIEEILADSAQVAYDEVYQDLGYDKTLLPKAVEQNIRQNALMLSKLVSDTLKQSIIEQVIEGYNLGEGSQAISRRVEGLLQHPLRVNVPPKYNADGSLARRGYTREISIETWSDIVARTESQKMAREVTIKSYEDLGVKKVQWFANPTACEICRPKDGHVYEINDAKSLQPLHPNCQCKWKPVVEKAIAGVIHTGIVHKGRERYLAEEE